MAELNSAAIHYSSLQCHKYAK